MLWHYLPCRRWLRGYMTQWNSPCLKDLCQQRLWKQWTCTLSRIPRYSTRHACLPMRPACSLTRPTLSTTMSTWPPNRRHETSLSTDKANTVDKEDNQAEVIPKPIRALLCHQFKRSVLWSVCGFGLYRTAEVVLVSSFDVCTAVQDAVMTNAHKYGLGSRPSYSMMIKMMVPRIFGVDTIHFDLYPGTHPAGML